MKLSLLTLLIFILRESYVYTSFPGIDSGKPVSLHPFNPKYFIWKGRPIVLITFAGWGNVGKRKTNTVKAFVFCNLRFYQVVPPGIEPGTHGFSVRCSTN